MRAIRERARQELESLGYDELTPDMVNELLDKPVIYLRAVPLTQEYHTTSLEGLNEYIEHLEKALKVQRRLRQSNWYELTQKFGPVEWDFEGETLSGVLDAAKRYRDRISPPKAGKNTLRSDMAGKRAAIKLIANICRKNNINLSSSPPIQVLQHCPSRTRERVARHHPRRHSAKVKGFWDFSEKPFLLLDPS